jgi:uncharacterized protein (DUF1330 family)
MIVGSITIFACWQRCMLSLAAQGESNQGRNVMKAYFTVGLSLLAGTALGAAAVQGLHAQAKPPVYYIAEIDVANIDAWQKDYAPRAQAVIKAAGGKVLAAGQKVTSIEGTAPKPRVAVIQWESSEQVQAWRNSAAFKELVPIREKLGTVRSFTVEGLAN